jgi:hypothetical protein
MHFAVHAPLRVDCEPEELSKCEARVSARECPLSHFWGYKPPVWTVPETGHWGQVHRMTEESPKATFLGSADRICDPSCGHRASPR